MNHQERLELLGALSRAGVTHYKSHDLEIRIGDEPKPRGLAAWLPDSDPAPLVPAQPTPQPIQPIQPIQPNEDATKKLTDLIETLKMDDASLVDKIFPAGAGG